MNTVSSIICLWPYSKLVDPMPWRSNASPMPWESSPMRRVVVSSYIVTHERRHCKASHKTDPMLQLRRVTSLKSTWELARSLTRHGLWSASRCQDYIQDLGQVCPCPQGPWHRDNLLKWLQKITWNRCPARMPNLHPHTGWDEIGLKFPKIFSKKNCTYSAYGNVWKVYTWKMTNYLISFNCIEYLYIRCSYARIYSQSLVFNNLMIYSNQGSSSLQRQLA
jgi:hypothetical protein